MLRRAIFALIAALLPAAVLAATCTKVYSDNTFQHLPPNNGSSTTARDDAVNVIANDQFVFAASPTGVLRIYKKSNGSKPNSPPTWSIYQTISIPDSIEASYSTFGASMAVDGNWLVVGQPGYQDPNYENAANGAAWTFYYSNVSQQYGFTGRLTNHNDTRQVAGAGFGSTVAVYQSTVLVSAPYCCDTSPRGAVYAFYYSVSPPQTLSITSAQLGSAWVPTARDGIVVPFEISTYQGFGEALTITEDYVWIGAWDAQGTTDTPGSPGPSGQGTEFSLPLVSASDANVSSTLGQLDYAPTFIPPAPSADAYCGYSSTPCDFDFEQWAFSCPGFDNGNGAVYVVTLLGTWQVAKRIEGTGNNYGQALSLNENLLVVADNASNVYIYERTYTLQQSSFPLSLTLSGSGWYGRGVSVYNTTLAIGGEALVEIWYCGTSAAALFTVSIALLLGGLLAALQL